MTIKCLVCHFRAIQGHTEQDLSYRKQITRQLRTQYVESIYRPNYPVTLKSRLRVTHGNCKRNHWIDHTRLSIVVELFDGDLDMWVRGQLAISEIFSVKE